MSKLSTEERDDIPRKLYAFTKQRKEPLEEARHVRDAIARFNQVKDVTDAERDEAWPHIRAAAKKFGVEIEDGGWRAPKSSGKSNP